MPLPDDMWIHICSYLKMTELLSMAQVSKTMHTLADSDELWRPLAISYLKNKIGPQSRGAKDLKNIKNLLKNSILNNKEIQLQKEKLKFLNGQKNLELAEIEPKTLLIIPSHIPVSPFLPLGYFFPRICNVYSSQQKQQKISLTYQKNIGEAQKKLDQLLKPASSDTLEHAVLKLTPTDF